MTSSSRVSLDDCFPLDDFPAQGGDVVGWGPHNVLHVSTRWSVSLYQANAQRAAARISAQRHPLASGASPMETGSFISGAKWSPSLVPERIYPPTARLAVSIGGHVLIYRVARQGNGRVSVSHGIGLQVAPRASPSLSASPSCEDESPKKRQRRGASERSDSSSEDSEEPPTRRHRRASRQAATNNLEKRGASLIDYVWWSDDVLIIITNMGLHLVDMKNRDEDDSEPHTVQLPPPAYRFDADGAPVPTCASCAIAIAASQPSFLMCAGMGSLRLFRISTGEGVRLIQSMEVPSLTALPTSLCATPMYTPQPTSETDSNCSETGWNVFVAMPLCVVRGCIMTTATSPQRSLSRKPTSPPIGCRWTVSAVYSAGMLPVDPFLRRFVVVPLHQNQPLRKETAKTLPSRETHAVLGYSRRALFVFFMDERPPKCLLSCPTLVEKFDVKDSAVVALGGLSVHPSSTLAAMVVQSGVPRLPPVHLHLVSADDHDSFLRVVLDGGWTTLAQNSNESLLEQTWMRLGELHPYAWETILPESHGTCFALRQYSSAWQRFVSRTQASAMADASTSPASSSVDVAQHSMAMELQSYRENYNQLREQYGVDVFLRHVVEDDFQELHSIPSGPAARWWHFLLAVWRRCPWDRSVLMELLLGNAVLVLARVSGYANFHMGPHDAAWAEGEGCATTSTMLCSSAAAAFIRLYLQCAENNDSVKPSERQSMWAPTPAWIASLSGFLNSTALCTQQVSRMVYPCSVCDKRDASALTLTLSHTSSHPLPVSGPSAVDETHTTAFSPKTFAPLSLFSTESVLVMCLSCGMSDFAVGPHCRLCGGVLK